MKNRKMLLPALLSIAVVFSLILPAVALSICNSGLFTINCGKLSPIEIAGS